MFWSVPEFCLGSTFPMCVLSFTNGNWLAEWSTALFDRRIRWLATRPTEWAYGLQ